MSINNEVRTVDNLNADVRLILEEITRFLNMEKLLPSFRNTITIRYHVECVLVFQRYNRKLLVKYTKRSFLALCKKNKIVWGCQKVHIHLYMPE